MTFNHVSEDLCGQRILRSRTSLFRHRIHLRSSRLEEDLRKNISMEYYEAGHMMYSPHALAQADEEDLANFIKSAM